MTIAARVYNAANGLSTSSRSKAVAAPQQLAHHLIAVLETHDAALQARQHALAHATTRALIVHDENTATGEGSRAARGGCDAGRCTNHAHDIVTTIAIVTMVCVARRGIARSTRGCSGGR
jgi:hypothetical protein